MGRPRRTTEEEWYDIFSAWDDVDQAVALRVLEQIHRMAKRAALPKAAKELLSSAPNAAQSSLMDGGPQ